MYHFNHFSVYEFSSIKHIHTVVQINGLLLEKSVVDIFKFWSCWKLVYTLFFYLDPDISKKSMTSTSFCKLAFCWCLVMKINHGSYIWNSTTVEMAKKFQEQT